MPFSPQKHISPPEVNVNMPEYIVYNAHHPCEGSVRGGTVLVLSLIHI